MRCALFSCMGLGDGLITQVLAHNLKKAGYQTVTFHPFLAKLQNWFPHLPLRSFPPLEKLHEEIESFDRHFIFYEKSVHMEKILHFCLEHYPKQTTVLNPIATPNCDYPFWEHGKFDGRRPFVDNLVAYCEKELKIAATKHNGLVVPRDIILHEHAKRVVIHPVSSRPGKNWTKKKFLLLRDTLQKEGYEIAFILTQEEKKEWPEVEDRGFSSLDEMTRFVASSGYMIGNDSGIGHLASCLGLPTLTICRHKMTADFWQPSWAPNRTVIPPSWIPNLKGMRWRDSQWQKFVPTARVIKEFRSLTAHKPGIFCDERA